MRQDGSAKNGAAAGEAARCRGHAADPPSYPLFALGVALLITTALIGWLLWGGSVESRANVSLLRSAVQATELKGRITYLDEALTMSARMAAATGNSLWKERYDRLVPVLDRAITDVIALSPPDVAAAVEKTTRVANAVLLDLEGQAFTAAAKGDLARASSSFERPAYLENKRIFAKGMTALSDSVGVSIDTRVHLLKERANVRMFAASVATLLVAGLWLNMTVTVCRWRLRAARSELRTSRLAEAALEGIVIHDDHVIIDANRAFAEMAGRDIGSLVGQSILGLFAADQLHAIESNDGGTEPEFVESTLRHRDGTLVPVELRRRTCDIDGRSVHLMAVRDIGERKRAAERIRHLAHFDALTDLPNRVLFWDRLGQALAQARRHRQQVAILCIDLDRFKEVNDTLGHAAGDRLLKLASRRLAASLRDSDTLARLGGDEFALIMTNLREGRLAAECAQRIVDALSASFDVDGNEVVIGASVGIALSEPNAENAPDAILRAADLALYRAKSDGRGTFRFFAEEMNVCLQMRKTLERQLRQAMVERQFELHYQPQVEAGTWRVVGAEALLRWRHPERGLLMPKDFVPLAEETGLIVPLGEWVLRTACNQAQPWGNLRLAVNLSATQFRQPGLAAVVAKALADSGMAPGRLEVEVTETILLQDVETSLHILQEIKRLGVRIAMDDFGTGYSSLSYLRTFPFDKIKIDRSFINDLGRMGEAAAIVRAVVQLGRSLGLRTSAEGVETRTQAEILLLDGCDEVQGFHFGRPMRADEFQAMMGEADPGFLHVSSSATAA